MHFRKGKNKEPRRPAVEGVGLTPPDHLSDNKELPSNGGWIFGSWLCLAFGLNLQLSEMVRKNPEHEMFMFCYRETVLISCLEPSLLEAVCHLTER